MFTPFGPIHSITIPKSISAASDTHHSQEAPEGPVSTLDPSEPVASTSTLTQPPKSKSKSLARGFAFVWYLSQPDAARAIEKANGQTIYAGYADDLRKANKKAIQGRKEIRQKKGGEDARKVIVDWAVSKEKWLEMQKERKEVDKENMVIDGEEKDQEKVEEEEDIEQQWVDESESDQSADDDEDDGEHPPQPEEGSTLFVRNVPFEATEDELKTL